VSYPPFVLEERPDVGAYQARDGEERWVAGCTFHPRCLAQWVHRSDAASESIAAAALQRRCSVC
jgi:hypothetical protein